MRRENPLCAIGNVDDANASVIATGKTADRTGDGSAVRRPCRPAEKEIRMLSCGDSLLSRAVCIRNYYGVFAFTHITTLKSETFSVGREADACDISQQLFRCAAQHGYLIERTRRADAPSTPDVIEVVAVGRES